MSALNTTNPLALQFLMTDDLYNVINEAELVNNSSQELLITTVQDPQISVPEISNIPVPVLESPTYFDYVGENNKYCLILINESSQSTMPPKELEALVSILNAKKQELKDVAILNLHKYPGTTFKALKDFFACNSLILFGINPLTIALDNIQSNQIVNKDGTKILATFSFSEMMNNLDKKKMFWAEMKKL